MNIRLGALWFIRKPGWIVSICIGGFFIFQGCNILNTRTPEKPSESSSSFVPPTSPSIVIDNLVNAIRERNTENYINCFIDSTFSNYSFTFQAAQSAQTAYSAIFHDWNLTSERTYFENLCSRVPTGEESALILTDTQLSIQSDSAVYTATYTLIIPHTVQDIDTKAQGTLMFLLSVDRNNNWAIHRWIDNATGNDFSWSDLKARFSS
ncbi:MAG: hypothetical protein ABSB78_06875 [Bacteroidota bacterium]